MDAAPIGDLARFAPLPAPFVDHLQRWWFRERQIGPHHPPAARAQALASLAASVAMVRSTLDADLAAAALSTAELRRRTGAKPSTVGAWYRRGVLIRSRQGEPDRANAVAILLMRQLRPTARRGWLPSMIVDSEPAARSWWCYEVDPATDTIQIVPTATPARGLRLTPWTGAAQIPGWHAVAGGGAVNPDAVVARLIREAPQRYAHLLQPPALPGPPATPAPAPTAGAPCPGPAPPVRGA